MTTHKVAEPTLADVLAEVLDLRQELKRTNDALKVDLSDPVWTHAHIARLMQVSVQYTRQSVVKSVGFPAPRRVPVGPQGAMTLRPRYDRDKVLKWYDDQPVDLSLSR